MKKILYVLMVVIILSLAALPVSAERDLRIGDKVNINGIEATIVGFNGGLPIYSAVIYPNISSYYDGFIRKTNSNYNATRTSASGDNAFVGSGVSYIGNLYEGYSAVYEIDRSYLYFNTSVLNGYTMTAGSISVYATDAQQTNGESIQIQSGMATYPHNPLVAGDYDLSNYAGNGGSKTIVSFSIYAYNVITLNATGYGWVNTSGDTKYCLRTTGDINNSAPSGENFVLYRSNYGANLPYLSVTFTALTPSINSVAVSNIAANSARFNSSVISDGGDTTCQIEFGYGAATQTAVNYAAYTTHTSVTVPVADYKQGDTPYLDVTGLIDGTTYYYRVKITNELTSVVSTTEQTFTTSATLHDMIQLTGYPSKANDTPIAISLNWLKAVGATNTLIRFRTDTFPTTTSGAGSGTLLYNDTGNLYVHSGLTAGTTYYYSAWGESGGVYSTNAVHLVLTTNPSISGGTLPTLNPVGGLFQEPNETFLVNLQPFYSVINGLADTWGMPRGNMWFMITMLLILAIGVGLYIKFSSPSLALFIMALVMGGFVTLHILPTFMLGVVFFLALGGWGTRPQI